MNIQLVSVRIRTSGVLQAELGRSCTLMQWFILFGLRASWTSSIIVIHRRKWAARSSAGAGGSPPPDSQSLVDTLAASTRELRCMSPTFDAFSRGPCVCASPWFEFEARSSHVQCSIRFECTHRISRSDRSDYSIDNTIFQAASAGSADWSVHCLRAHGECDRSLHARARYRFIVSISRISQNDTESFWQN